MSSFSSILDSINGKPPGPQHQAISQRPKTNGQQTARPTSLANGAKPVANNAVAGVKRRSEEPQPDPRAKVARVEKGNGSTNGAAAAPPSRFQLTTKPGTQQKPQGVPHRPASTSTAASSSDRTMPKLTSKPTDVAGANTSTGPAPAKRGFASIMQKAKAAQEAAKVTGPSGIKHKAAEKLTKRERAKQAQEAEAQRQAEKAREKVGMQQSKDDDRPTSVQKGQETSYKGTMRKPSEPLSYKGTMQAAVPGEARTKKQKGQAQDKYGGYASWSDLDDAEDEEEDYDSEGSSDMEGGFDDVEREELTATRAARKEDQEALEEEERLKREKMERKRKLLELSKSAATRKKY